MHLHRFPALFGQKRELMRYLPGPEAASGRCTCITSRLIPLVAPQSFSAAVQISESLPVKLPISGQANAAVQVFE